MQLVLCETPISSDAEVLNYSPFCLKVHAALRTWGFDYQRRFDSPMAFRKYNPAGQVPVLLVDGTPLADSTRIVRFLASKRTPVATDTAATAESWLWEDYADRGLNGFLVAARWADPANWPLVREAYFGQAPVVVRKVVAPLVRRRILKSLVLRDVTRGGLAAAWEEFRALLPALDARAPEHNYWCGDEPTPADFALYGQLGGLRTRLTVAQRAWLEEQPRLTAYLDRMHTLVHCK